ncbi:ABC transporter G family member 6 [Hibiscus syriacus]|uniref:ABC transporter G family member 6 n=1 Tax=Hibiscus syriacus TaxID=106335 RepID=A0A6A2YZW7_HIBSY|nr:ABC transporter G family member 20-like [Hibiscus syriacus]KAE8684810.1 ABC transporter G family member 6 [Hibiscus syriacus]
MEIEELPSEEHEQILDVQVESSSSPILDPFVLSFKNLTYDVKVSSKTGFPFLWKKSSVSSETNTKSLLKGISGEAREGEIMAILGASGSGKSTLIDALANRISKHSLKGTITLNGEVLDSGLSKVISAYVMQDDLLFPMLTVEETLMFSAEFRLPRSVSKKKKRERVRALIDQLGLRNAAKTVIGDEGHRGVSGGERRRVSIGIDIIHDPILLFLDEPTSGLDSTSAFMVVKVLKRIAQSGSIVIMAIHQPSSRILGLIDRLIILSHGRTLYNDSPANLSRFFSDFGQPIPRNENPSEFALDLIRELEETPSVTQNLFEFNKSWKASSMDDTDGDDDIASNKRTTLPLKDAIGKSISRGKLVSRGGVNQSLSVPSFANPFYIEVMVLSKRLLTNSRRMPAKFAVRLGTITVTGIVLATMFWQLDNSPAGVQERLGCISISIATIFFNCITEVPTFIQERYIFMRETAYNAYRRSSYVLARSITHIPLLFNLALTLSLITFWTVGLAGGVTGFLFFFVTILAAFWAGSSFAAFISGLIPDVFLAFVSGIAIVSYFLFLCGFLVARDRLPKYWLWFHYISLIKYPYEAILQNEFLDPTECYVMGVQLFDQTALGSLPPPVKSELLTSMGRILGRNITSSTCLTTGKDILKLQGITELSKWNCVWVTVAWGFFFRILFYLTLLFGSQNKRK